jgi:hypothetical protein
VFLSFDVERFMQLFEIRALYAVTSAELTNRGGHPGRSQEAEGSAVSAMIRLRAARFPVVAEVFATAEYRLWAPRDPIQCVAEGTQHCLVKKDIHSPILYRSVVLN